MTRQALACSRLTCWIRRWTASPGWPPAGVIAGDLTIARAPGQHALVYLVYNAISCLLTQAGQVACFRNAARHLTPGGRFVVELWVPELRLLPPGQQAVAWPSGPGYIVLDTYDVLRQHVVSHHFRFGGSRQARLFRSPHRYIWPAELDLMAQLAGFELETRHADWPGAEFTAESRSHVSVYRIPPGHRAVPGQPEPDRGG
jgi:hypothetical protein